GPHAAADHAREAAGPPRRVVADARLRGGVLAGSDRAAARHRPPRSRVRRVGREAGAPGAGGDEGRPRRARRDQEADRRENRRAAMTPLLQIAGWTLIHFVWQGAAIAAATATALRLLRDRSANARYIVACAGLTLMLAAPTTTARLMWNGPPASIATGGGVAAGGPDDPATASGPLATPPAV